MLPKYADLVLGVLKRLAMAACLTMRKIVAPVFFSWSEEEEQEKVGKIKEHKTKKMTEKMTKQRRQRKMDATVQGDQLSELWNQ